MTEKTVQVPVSLIERIEETTQALQKMPILAAGSGIPDVTFNLNVVTGHFNAVHAAVAEVTALLSQPTPTAEAIACPHWESGRITMRNGCTACAAEAAPPSIADMVPGTTFVGSLFSGIDCEGLVLRFHVIARERLQDDRGNRWTPGDIDPSTIRDVTPPKDAS